MFSNRSTDNLLDNLEKELEEVIELDNPVKVDISTEVKIENEKVANYKIDKNQPVPTKRIFGESSSDLPNLKTHRHPPAIAARKVQQRDKRLKNNENEIIQLSSISSNSHSSDNQKHSEKTILRKNSEKVSVDANDAETVFIETETEEKLTQVKQREVEAKVEILSKKPYSTSISTSSCVSSSEASSSSTSEKAKRFKKKKKSLDKQRKSKSKPADEITTEKKTKQSVNEKIDRQEIVAVVHSCGPLKFNLNFKSGLKIRISLYNEDTGKLIEEAKITKFGEFNKDFL